MIKEKTWTQIPIEKLVPADWNYKEDDEVLSEKLENNIKRNGQIENIIVRKLDDDLYEVVNGNHRLSVFEKLGIKKPVCFDLGKITDAQAKRIAIETNETRFETDSIKLAEIIKEISEMEFEITDLAMTFPFDEQELTNMQTLLDFDWDQFNNDDDPPGNTEEGSGGGPTGDSNNEKTIDCPKCGFKINVKDE